MKRFFVAHYSGTPFLMLFTPCNSNITTNAIKIRFTIFHILFMRCFTQITKSIVVSNAIYMINLIARPSLINKKPSKPMRHIYTTFYLNRYISIRSMSTSNCSNFNGMCRFFNPCKYACFLVIRKMFFQPVKINIAHAVAPFMQCLGSNGLVLAHRAVAPL